MQIHTKLKERNDTKKITFYYYIYIYNKIKLKLKAYYIKYSNLMLVY